MLFPDHTGVSGAKHSLITSSFLCGQVQRQQSPKEALPCTVLTLGTLSHLPPGTIAEGNLFLPMASAPTRFQTPSLPILNDSKFLFSSFCVPGPLLITPGSFPEVCTPALVSPSGNHNKELLLEFAGLVG